MLKVGELAKRTGLTVRTLHHYDEIGLLVPSGRSDSGYRLYRDKDVAKLHAIQALRQFGLTLAEIGEMLALEGMTLSTVVSRQIQAMDEQISQAQQLRTQLKILESALLAGDPPEMGDWLATLDQMATYRNYFSNHELQKIFRNWKQIRDEWPPLIEAVRKAYKTDLHPDSIEVQRLAQDWMNLSMRWMQNDLNLARRWGEMAEQEPHLEGQYGIDATLIRYVGKAIQLRMDAFHRHLSNEDIQKLDKGLHKDWARLSKRAAQLIEKNTPLNSAKATKLARDWETLIDKMTGHDTALRSRFEKAYRQEPILRIGHVVPDNVREFIFRIQEASGSTGIDMQY